MNEINERLHLLEQAVLEGEGGVTPEGRLTLAVKLEEIRLLGLLVGYVSIIGAAMVGPVIKNKPKTEVKPKQKETIK